MSQTITPNLWFDGNAAEAVDFYVAAFGAVADTAVTGTVHYPTEGLLDFQQHMAGEALTVDFTIDGQAFTAINAGPQFQFTPSISFIVNFDPSRDAEAREHLDTLWASLTDGGTALMELGEYPFSDHYGWVRDRYGLTWQLMLTNPTGEPRPFLIPALMFSDAVVNRAGEAIEFYTALFGDSAIGTSVPYAEATGSVVAGSVMFADFTLAGDWFAAMDSPVDHGFTFNEAVSFSVPCADQAEIDRLWSALSAVPEAEQCGWCKDRFGVSWQIIPANLAELMARPDSYAHLMAMHKIVIDDF